MNALRVNNAIIRNEITAEKSVWFSLKRQTVIILRKFYLKMNVYLPLLYCIQCKTHCKK